MTAELVQVWEDPTCVICVGEWVKGTGQTVTIDNFTYLVCEDCCSQGKLWKFKQDRTRRKVK